MLAGEEDRSARAICVVAVANSGGEVRVFRGEVAGTVAPEPRGTGGFGYDAIFVPGGDALTYAELGDEKNTDSHRARAFRAVREWLEGG
jgi:XTP/dITP diphosphohydrolase